MTCDPETEADLFWALHGGGGNFGVVSSARIRLHNLESVFTANIIFAWADARAALSRYADIMFRAPADLFGAAILSIGLGCSPVVVITLVWTGEPADGEAYVMEIAAAGSPIMAKSGCMLATWLLSLTDGKLAQGLGYDVATRWFRVLGAETIDALIAAFDNRTSPLSTIIVHHCHGAATQVAPGATAFGMRQPHFTALIYATWKPASEDDGAHSRWAQKLDAVLKSTALPGGYANLLSETAKQQIAHAYGLNAARLAQVKARYDPDCTLNAIPLPPSD